MTSGSIFGCQGNVCIHSTPNLSRHQYALKQWKKSIWSFPWPWDVCPFILGCQDWCRHVASSFFLQISKQVTPAPWCIRKRKHYYKQNNPIRTGKQNITGEIGPGSSWRLNLAFPQLGLSRWHYIQGMSPWHAVGVIWQCRSIQPVFPGSIVWDFSVRGVGTSFVRR